ncbi:MAG: tetratricopeptide repeat protein [Chloroflexota bacterium]
MDLTSALERIRSEIEAGEAARAVARCKELLAIHPKWATVHCLLGQALMGLGDFPAAEEAFRLALAVDPEDVVANAGLGAVSQERNDLGAARFFYQLAWELAPDNQPLARTLARTLGSRDGRQGRIGLTTPGLARVYLRGALYARAADESERALAAEPGRLDLLVLEAEALWRAGERSKAAVVAESILARFPNCLKALLILGAHWDQTYDSEAGERLLSLARGLDPLGQAAEALGIQLDSRTDVPGAK